jgi:uncharacterized protein YoxC
MVQDEARLVRQFQMRLGGVLLIKYGLAALAIWAFSYGSLVLALRGALGISRLDLLWGLLSLPLALIPAVVLAWKRVPTLACVRAVIDRHSRCGGLLMTSDEQSLGSWQQQLPTLELPAVQHRSRRGWTLFGLGLAFIGLAFAVPQGFTSLSASALDISREVEKLQQQLQVLEQEKILEKQRADDLKTKLEQVRQQAQANNPSRTLDALDHLQNLAQQAAREAAQDTNHKMEQLARAEMLAKAIDKLGGQLPPGQLDEAVRELASLSRKAANEEELLENGLDKDTLEALQEGKLSEEALQKLAESLKNCKEAKLGKMGRLVKAKLLDAEALEKCDKAGECDGEALAAFLKECGACQDLANLLAQGEMPGKGGVTRGPGAAKLEFGDESTPDGVKFKEEELPPAALQSLKESQLSGISLGAPDKNPEKNRAPAASGALAGAASGGGSANNQVILPRHRGTVERYFERPARK